MKNSRKKGNDAQFEEIADVICNSYYVLVVIGENFSQTSGYQLIESITMDSCYRQQNVTPKQLLSTHLLETDDELFYGLWGQAMNKFQTLKPNQSYSILQNWRSNLFDDNDTRFIDKKASANTTAPKITKGPSRFFLITSNIDSEVFKAGFSESEVFETRGNILTWQCAKPCSKIVWNVPEDFRFDVNKTTGRAAPIKYVEVKRKSENLQLKEAVAERLALRKSQTFDIGNEEEFNFEHALGVVDYSKISSPQKNTLPMNINERRAMYYRYFVPWIAEQVKDSNAYLLPGIKQTFKSIRYGASVILPLNPKLDFVNQSGAKIDSTIQRFDLQPAAESSISGSREGKNSQQSLNEIPSTTDNSSLMGSQTARAMYSSGNVKMHQELHLNVFECPEDSVTGVFDITVIDPLIHHHDYFTDVSDGDQLKKVIGSDSMFAISLQIRNQIKGETAVHYYVDPIKPSIRSKCQKLGIFVDTMIIDVQEQISIDRADHMMPFSGIVSLVVEPLMPKSKYSVMSAVGKICKAEERPWQICGQYNVSHLKMSANVRSKFTRNEKRVVDFTLKSKDSPHELRIRTLQSEGIYHEIVAIFVSMPISNFTSNVLATVETIPIAPPSELILSANWEPITERPRSAYNTPRSSITKKKESRYSQENHAQKKPIVNRIMCPQCHGKARPRVKMTDDKTWQKTNPAKYKAWVKAVTKEIKEDPKKPLLVLELGAEPAVCFCHALF